MLPSGHEVGAGSAMVSKMILETLITVETFPPNRGFCFHQEKSFQDLSVGLAEVLPTAGAGVRGVVYSDACAFADLADGVPAGRQCHRRGEGRNQGMVLAPG